MNRMTTAALCAAAALSCGSAAAKNGFADQSPLSITDFAICTAAAMKSGKGIAFYEKWSAPLTKRYAIIFPKKTPEQIDTYTTERINDKRRGLERKGVMTTQAFFKFYESNCKGYEPK